MHNGSDTYYYRFNLQGDVTGIYNSSGILITEYTYDAWGKPEQTSGNTFIGLLNPIRYRGYYYDTETGLYYLQSRYYDPETGRFINPDGVIASINDSVQGFNQFVYCFNNPVNMSDPTGYWPKWDIFVQGALLIGMGIVAVAAVVSTGGAATPAVALAYATIATAGTLTVGIGASEVYESFTDTNPIREDIGEDSYDDLKSASLATISLGMTSLPALQKMDAPTLPSVDSKGSTAKIFPKNLTEQLAMEQVKSNPSAGTQLTRITLNDPRWPSSEGWVKMQQIVPTSQGNINIHYVYNQTLNIFDDFKFKP